MYLEYSVMFCYLQNILDIIPYLFEENHLDVTGTAEHLLHQTSASETQPNLPDASEDRFVELEGYSKQLPFNFGKHQRKNKNNRFRNLVQ